MAVPRPARPARPARFSVRAFSPSKHTPLGCAFDRVGGNYWLFRWPVGASRASLFQISFPNCFRNWQLPMWNCREPVSRISLICST